MAATLTVPRATLDDLARVEGKAELIGGKLVHYAPSGHLPSVVVGRIVRRLADYAEDAGGFAFSSTIGFAVPELSTGRESFSPDVAYYTGPLPANAMRFIPGPPDFAVEVRSENDYGPAAEAEMAGKRAEYFEAGTKVVWDVDPVARVVRSYRTGEPTPTEFRIGQQAGAEPAVPGWRLAVDWLMA